MLRRPYGQPALEGQALHSSLPYRLKIGAAAVNVSPAPWEWAMIGIAVALFIAPFGWGSNYFGWSDPDGKIQLALATCFILGVLSGYKAKS
jgi:hypothetical protein